ncbi:N-acyl homoserine lactonase family protein [Ampullimonas aquatilis]|uniref:N-acyl homoserine lactonase family protein n=1 Tax=Ampullimonas aquatilis TaxID=1341549 RepID=UPI003C763656
MFKNQILTSLVLTLGTTASLTSPMIQAAEPVTSVRLYALDCGKVDVKDMSFFSDTGEYDGKPATLVDPCYVIRHPKGTLVWDTGLGDKMAESKDGVTDGVFHMVVPVTLSSQLKAIGLTPDEVEFVAFSHFHFDHTGNANLFEKSTWIVNQNEVNWATSTPSPFGVNAASFSNIKQVKTQMITGDHDVFGDGSVRIFKVPGHTPGSQVLAIKLNKAGTVILSGDLYHTKDNRKYHRVPGFNVSRADTLASIDRIETIVKNTHGRLYVQHDANDFKALPKFPAYLE